MKNIKEKAVGIGDRRALAKKIIERLDGKFPDAHTALKWKTPLELLVATILSAQCTDERVNKVTPQLFAKYPTARHFAEANLSELEEDIRSTGFYRQKAKALKECCSVITEKFGGQIPQTLEEMLTLPGVGRKTANLVLGESLGIPGIVVDTHVKRVAARLGLTDEKDPEKIETDLMGIIPKEKWTTFSNQLILLGRHICKAKKPLCDSCPLSDICVSASS